MKKRNKNYQNILLVAFLSLFLAFSTTSFSQVQQAPTYLLGGQDVEFGITLWPGTIIIDTWDEYEGEEGYRIWVLTATASSTQTLSSTDDKQRLNSMSTATWFNSLVLNPMDNYPIDPKEGELINYQGLKLMMYQGGSWREYIIYNPINN